MKYICQNIFLTIAISLIFSLALIGQSNKYLKLEKPNGKEHLRIEPGQAFEYKIKGDKEWRYGVLKMLDGQTQTFGTDFELLKPEAIEAIKIPTKNHRSFLKAMMLVSGINILGGATYEYIRYDSGLQYMALGAGLIGSFFLIPNKPYKSKSVGDRYILKVVDLEGFH